MAQSGGRGGNPPSPPEAASRPALGGRASVVSGRRRRVYRAARPGRPPLSPRGLPPCQCHKGQTGDGTPLPWRGWAPLIADAARPAGDLSATRPDHRRPRAPTPSLREWGIGTGEARGAPVLFAALTATVTRPCVSPSLTRLRLARALVLHPGKTAPRLRRLHCCAVHAFAGVQDRLQPALWGPSVPTCVTALRIPLLAFGSLGHVVVSVPCAVGASPHQHRAL